MPSLADNDTIAVELMIREAARNRLYGSLEIKYEDGKIVLIVKKETIKPQSYRSTRGDDAR